MFACVLREVSPRDFQYVPVSEVLRDGAGINPKEALYTADWHCQSENLGPYGSHKRTICLPKGAVTTHKPYVLREVEGTGELHYVPLCEIAGVHKGEKLYAGEFVEQPLPGSKCKILVPQGDVEVLCTC